jgi:hypothetical protein
MTRRASLLLLVLSALACTCAFAPAASAKPASFKAWSSRWQTTLSTSFGVGGAECSKGSDSQKGQCFAKATMSTYRAIDPLFVTDIAAIEKGQTPGCRKAISGYSVAFRKTATAVQAYLRAHTSSATLSQIKHDFAQKPYTTLDALVKTTNSRAVRICG